VQLERDPLDEIADVVGSSDLVRVWRRCSASNRDSPAMCVVWRRQSITLLLRECYGSVAIDDGSVDAEALSVYQ